MIGKSMTARRFRLAVSQDFIKLHQLANPSVKLQVPLFEVRSKIGQYLGERFIQAVINAAAVRV